MAEGLILLSEHSGILVENMEDVAYECFCELVQRCMVQEGEWDLTGRTKTCRVHDLMRDMSLF